MQGIVDAFFYLFFCQDALPPGRRKIIKTSRPKGPFINEVTQLGEKDIHF